MVTRNTPHKRPVSYWMLEQGQRKPVCPLASRTVTNRLEPAPFSCRLFVCLVALACAATASVGRGQWVDNPLRSVQPLPDVASGILFQSAEAVDLPGPDAEATAAPPAGERPPATADDPASKPFIGFLTPVELSRRKLTLEAAADIETSVKADLLKHYAKAEEWLQAAAETVRQIDAWNLEIKQTPATVAGVRQQLEQPLPEVEARYDRQASVEDLQKILDQHQEQLRTAREELAAREAAVKIRDRKSELVRLGEETNKQLEEVRKRLAIAPPPGENVAATLAQRTETEAHLTALDQQLRALDAESKRLDAVAELLTLQRDLVQRRVSHLEKTVAAWQDAVAQRRKMVAQASVQEALQVREQDRAWQGMDSSLEELGQRDAELAQHRADLAVKLAGIAKEVETKAKLLDDVRRAQRNTVEKVQAAGLSSTIGLMLRDQRDQLPDVAQLRSRLFFVEREMPDSRYRAIELKEERQRIGDPDGSVQEVRDRLAQPMSDEAWKTIEPKVREALQRQRRTLDDLLRDYDLYLDDLSNLEVHTRRLLLQVDEFAGYIDERILWIRSTEPLSLRTLTLAREQLRKLAMPAVWSEAIQHGFRRIGHQPIRVTALVVVWGILFLFRRTLRRWFDKLVRPMDDSFVQSMTANLEAVVLTIAIASVWPLFVGVTGWIISRMAIDAGQSVPPVSAAAVDLFAALGIALTTTAYVYWLAEIARQVFRQQGLAIAHLGWDPTTAGLIRRVIRRLMLTGLPLVLLVNFTEAFDHGLARDALGRLVFLAAIVVLSFMGYREFHPRGVLFESLVQIGSETGNYRRRAGIFWLLMGILLVLAILSVSGFHYSANQLAARLTESLWFVLGVLLVRSLLARWLFIRQWKLARRLSEELAAETGAVETELPAEGEEAEENVADRAREAKRKEQERTLVRIDQQLQKLLRLGVTTAMLIGLWMIWSGVLPALRALDRIPVWPLSSVVKTSVLPPAAASEPTEASRIDAGPAALLPVQEGAPIEGTSLGDLLLMLLIAFLTIAAGKNLPGLLEVTLLERLPLDRGARNAVTTLSGYAIMLAGLLMGANAIGLRWQSIQWLAAALTVGLGFGLQEIFANFVSGLILLFERPIRVGDIITLGDVDGTVTKIRIRATTITNWDRKELIVPNKELITGRLLNWTLSDQINRLVVQVGVAYGSNVAKVRRLMLRIANDHPVVLKDPGPVVTFESFGDSALIFVLRCYLPSLENRLATIHDLHAAIHDRFAREGIEIAFPQLDLHVRSAPPGSLPGDPK
ncbi:MAG: mechanosensitive ion channel [Pirellulaceae bacterium]|nr:mechanosensitive ion channel [Pirellulaceae bacterium]